MVRIQQVFGLLRNLKGTANLTLNKRVLTEVVKTVNLSDDANKVIQGVLSGMKSPKLKIACKNSEQGFTIAGFQFLNEGRALANGAVSLTGKGVEDAVVKLRSSIGEKGKYVRLNLWTDLGKDINLFSSRFNTSINDDILGVSAKVGDTFGTNIKLNIKEAVDETINLAKKYDIDIIDDMKDVCDVEKLNCFNIQKFINEVLTKFMNCGKKLANEEVKISNISAEEIMESTLMKIFK